MSEAELFERRREIVGVGIDAEGRRVVLLERNSGELEEEVAEAFGDVETKVVGKVKPMVFEEELPRPLEAYRGEKVVPLVGGVSYGLLKGPTGTMGAVVYDRYTNKPMLLSASHVVGIWGRKRLAHAGSPTISPGEADGGDPEDVVGSLRRWTDTRAGVLALADASASLSIVPVKGEIAGIGKVEGWAEPEVGGKVVKSGRSSGITEGRIELVNATVRVDGGEAGVVTFVNQVVTDRPMMLPGDSVTGDTRILFRVDGVVRYADMWELYRLWKMGKRIEVATVKRSDNREGSPTIRKSKLVFTPLAEVVYHGKRPVYEITFHNGKRVKVTEDHSLIGLKRAVGDDNFLRPITINDLEQGAMVITVEDYSNLIFGYTTGLSKDLLTLMGLWIGDGSYCTKNGQIEGLAISTGGNKDIISFISKFGFREKNKGDYRLYNKSLAGLFYRCFGYVRAYNKRIPEWILLAPLDELSAFLRGYFSADGSIHLKKGYVVIDCASVSRGLLEDVQFALNRFGIRSNIDSGYIPTKFSKRRQYKLRIEGKLNVETFLDKIGFIKSVKPEFYEILRNQGAQRKKRYRLSRHGVREIRYLGIQDVFDLKVPGTEMFIGNGVLLHNSGSAFLDEENRIVALGFAGSDKISIATPISTVCRLLDVLPTPRARMEPVPTPLLKSLVLSVGIYGVVKLYELMKVRKWAG